MKIMVKNKYITEKLHKELNNQKIGVGITKGKKKVTLNDKTTSFKKNKKFTLIYIIFSFLISTFLSYIFSINKNWNFLISFIIFGILFLAFNLILLLIQNDQEGYKFWLKIFLNIISMLILAGQLLVLIGQSNLISVQTDISDKQTQILEQTSQSIKPDVRVVSAQGYNSFPLSNIDNETFTHTISIGIVNLGKINAPFVAVYTKYPGLFFGYSHYIDENRKLIDGTFSIGNFPSLNYTSFWFYFSKDTRNNSVIKPGINNLVFIVDCPFCQESMKEQVIPICIYTNDASKGVECGREYL